MYLTPENRTPLKKEYPPVYVSKQDSRKKQDISYHRVHVI